MSDNPWQSPHAEAAADESVPQGILTPLMVRYLKEASPWIRFIGVLSYIGAGLFALMGGFFVIAMLARGSLFDAEFLSVLPGASMGSLYLVAGVLVFFPARFTYGFGTKLRNYLASNGEKDLEEALRHNRALWKFNGILAIVYLAFFPLAIAGFVIAIFSSPAF
ncbi:MAG: hypothetical protein LBI94_01870 [Treponema sp.]|jgi:hypothetical protein|nr:hypothetical protein [Treponema sp.]